MVAMEVGLSSILFFSSCHVKNMKESIFSHMIELWVPIPDTSVVYLKGTNESRKGPFV